MTYSCHISGSLEDALNLPPRHADTDWCRDQARGCRAYPADDPDSWPDECFGCIRKFLSVMQEQGKASVLAHRVGRRAA